MWTNHRPAFQSCDNNITKKKAMAWKHIKNNKISKTLHLNFKYLETIKIYKTYMNRFVWLWYRRCHGVWSDWNSIKDFRNQETQSSWLDTWLNTCLHAPFQWTCYRPQRSWGKVMFSQACVILFTGGVSASVHAGIPPPLGADTSRADTPWEQTPPREQTPPSMLGDTVNTRAVRILLECNLVLSDISP